MQQKTNMIFGRHPVVDAMRRGQSLDKILLQKGTRGEFEKEIRHLSKANHIPVQVVPKERLNSITRKNHQGIVAYLSLLNYYKLEDVLPSIYEKGEVPLLLVLDGVTDVRNFGAIARSALCCGVHAMVIPNKGSAQINAEAIKTSAGALTDLLVCRSHSLVKAIEQLQLAGIQVFASDLSAEKLIFDLDFKIPAAIIIGAEDKGVSKALLAQTDKHFIIPQSTKINSFNVSVASGIVLYEVMRQRF
ncbi:MAG: 23S rRNA (guanosine(2251)-2'-O)-methyltransferase RlmB [Bacteroidota bacterium]